MGSARILAWFGDETDPGANPPAAAAFTASSAAAPTNGQIIRFRSRDFDQTTDEALFWMVALPSNYSSGGTLNFSWLSTATSGDVVWKTAYKVVHPSSEASPTDLDAAALGTVTSSAAITTPATAGYVKQTSLDLGVTGAHAGDLLVVYFGRDASDAADTVAADIKLLEPWYLTFTTV